MHIADLKRLNSVRFQLYIILEANHEERRKINGYLELGRETDEQAGHREVL